MVGVYIHRYTRHSAEEVLDDEYNGTRERRRLLESDAGCVAGSLTQKTVAIPIGVFDLESIIQGAVVGAEQTYEALTEEENVTLRSLLDHEISENTKRNFRSQWKLFQEWAETRGVESRPADPVHIVAYLLHRVCRGDAPSTLRASVTAISHMHKVVNQPDPCGTYLVRRTLSAVARRVNRVAKQAAPLTENVFERIREVACTPRTGRGGGLERQETAVKRGNLDIAMIGMMRDGLLRVSEAAAVVWSDIEARPDGSGRLMIRRSKTDREGRGFVAYMCERTMSDLERMRNGAPGSARVIGLRPNQIARRIKRAAQQAGAGDRFSGHSCRVGMACDLAREGIDLPRIMHAGRWTSAEMVAHYTRNETAGKNAVAQFYSFRFRMS